MAGIGLALVLCAPAVAATPRDEASAHTFLVATARLLHSVIDRRHEETTGVGAVITHVDADCPMSVPSLGSGTPGQQQVENQFAIAAEAEVIFAEIHPLGSAYHSFSRAVAHLRWTNPDLGRRIAAAGRQGDAIAALRAPDLCRQASLARTSNFTRTPPGIRAFVRRFSAATSTESLTTAELEQLATPLAGPGDLELVKQVHQLQQRVNRIITGLAGRGLPALHLALFK